VVVVFLLLLFFRMEYLMNSEHFYFPTEFLLRNESFYFFRPEYTISDEVIELNSVWNRSLVSCEYWASDTCNFNSLITC
jgi:hypothetical protein